MNRRPVSSLIGLMLIAAVVLFAWGVAGCAQPPHQPNDCRGLDNARVSFDGAPGYTAGSVVWNTRTGKSEVYFHSGTADGSPAPYNGEPHFHFLVPCEQLRVKP